jgi:hypothetical protein
MITLASFESILGKTYPLPIGTWAAAHLIGAARTKVNNQRAIYHDRGREGNIAADLWGVVGELLLRRILLAHPDGADAARYIEQHLFIPKNGQNLKGPDLYVETPQGRLGIDAKSFNCKQGYSYFAIAKSKHEKLQSNCFGYFAVLTPQYGKTAVVARLVPYTDVDRWQEKKLRWDGNVSKNLLIAEFIQQYCPFFEYKKLCANRYTEGDVQTMAHHPNLRKHIVRAIPTLAQHLP